jgi:lipooligosaccharide transport system ATP-binding protein
VGVVVVNTSVAEALVLNFFNVHKQFGEREVLRGLSLGLGRGTCVALLGRNGAGKSTTVSLALGLTQPDLGRVDLFTTDMSDPEAHKARARVGVVSQYDSLDPDFTVVENLFVYGRYFGLSRQVMEQRVAELLAFADLADRRHDPVASLSGGMRRRLMLARALVAKPEVLFLDEPTTGLDPQARHAIWSGLTALKREGVAMLLTSHDMVLSLIHI